MKQNILLAVLLLSPLFTGAGQEIHWEEAAQFDVEMQSKPDISAKVFQPRTPKPMLLLTSERFTAPLLMDLSSKSVTAISKSALKEAGEHAVSTAGVPKGKKVASYVLNGGASVFQYNGMKVSLRIKESLVGSVTEGILLAHSPTYRLLSEKYAPKKSSIDFIRHYGEKTDIVVLFATWCPTCKQMVPKFLRILHDSKNENFTVKYIGIAMGGSEPRHELDKYGHDYPAVIFYQNGKEKGRIIGDPPVPLEDSIVSILKKKS